MNEKLLILIELLGRFTVSAVTIFVVVNLLGKWFALPICIVMFLWMLNPIFEYKEYGGK